MRYSAIRRHRIASRTAGDCRAAVPGAAGVALGASGADVGAPSSTRNWPQTPAPALAEVLQHGSATVRDYRGYLLIWSAAPSAPCHRGLFAAMATYSDMSSHPDPPRPAGSARHPRQDRQCPGRSRAACSRRPRWRPAAGPRGLAAVASCSMTERCGLPARGVSPGWWLPGRAPAHRGHRGASRTARLPGPRAAGPGSSPPAACRGWRLCAASPSPLTYRAAHR